MRTLRFNALKLINERKQKQIYDSMHKEAKHEYESVGWISKERQSLRFGKLINGLDLNGKTVLDFGCGLGALYAFLSEKKIEPDYTGIDIMECFVKKNTALYPKARFLKNSIFDVKEKFDFIFSSGTYAFCSKELFVESLKRSFELANVEYRFNILLNAKGGGFLKISEKELKQTVLAICQKAVFEYGYLENDMTVYMPRR